NELVNVVDHNRHTRDVVEGRCAETRASLKPGTLNIDGRINVEEARLASNLAKLGLSEGLLHNDVEESMHDIVVFHLGILKLLTGEEALRIDVDADFILDAAEFASND